MLIETTDLFETKEDAEDSLAGVKTLPGFLFGYIRDPYASIGAFSLIYVFNCAESNGPPIKKQRKAGHLEINEEAIYNLYRSTHRFTDRASE